MSGSPNSALSVPAGVLLMLFKTHQMDFDNHGIQI